MCTNQRGTQLTTPDRKGIKFPSGHVLVNEKWRKDTLGREISKRVKIAYSDALGFIDFYLTEECPLVYLSETDLQVNQKECKKKISKLNSVSNGRGLVIATWNSKIITDFSDIQEYATLDLDLSVIPISCQTELPVVLHKLAMHMIKSPQKDKKGMKSGPSSNEQVSLLNKIPGIGDREANQLLQRFGNIVSICDASEDVLKCTLGERLATHVFQFFNRPIA